MRFLLACLFGLSLSASAQLGDTWVEFALDPTLLAGSGVSDPATETDLAWGDLDQDGDTDLVVVRVEPVMGGGGRTNMLLMNEAGRLVDRTQSLGSASDFPGDQGLLSPTSDRDVVVVDVNGDGWLDVVTALGFGLPSVPLPYSHPRVYVNLGDDPSGTWLGLRYEVARIQGLVSFITGLPVGGRFNSVAAGDVNGDGAIDLYFGDHDGTPLGPFMGEPKNWDTGDRLYLNDGNGYFTDATLLSLTQEMVDSDFNNSVLLADFNLDGRLEMLKQDNVGGWTARANAAYADPLKPGVFTTWQEVYTGAPYALSGGDVNGDGRLDVIVSDNGLDGVIYNQATLPSGQVQWSAPVPFEFLFGADDGFASNSLMSDLDGDGRGDILIADVDPQISGFTRRLHIYHNRGLDAQGTPVLREERQSAASSGWVGLVGPTEADLQATHDVAVFDIDGDGLDDLVISRNSGTETWRRLPTQQTDLGGGAPGLLLEVSGNKLSSGKSATLTLSGAAPGAGLLLLASDPAAPLFVPLLDATLLASAPFYVGAFSADTQGQLVLPLEGGGGPRTVVVQGLVANGLATLFSPTNAVAVELF